MERCALDDKPTGTAVGGGAGRERPAALQPGAHLHVLRCLPAGTPAAVAATSLIRPLDRHSRPQVDDTGARMNEGSPYR